MAGKGDKPRPIFVSKEDFERKWEKAFGKKDYTLKELLKGVTKENIHGEINTGPDVGKEIIEE